MDDFSFLPERVSARDSEGPCPIWAHFRDVTQHLMLGILAASPGAFGRWVISRRDRRTHNVW